MINQEKTLELVDRSQRKDTAAFAQLVTEFQPMVFRLAFRLLCDEDEARDITQETFVKAIKAVDRFKGDCDIKVWLCQIAKNTYFTYAGKQNREQVDVDAVNNRSESQAALMGAAEYDLISESVEDSGVFKFYLGEQGLTSLDIFGNARSWMSSEAYQSFGGYREGAAVPQTEHKDTGSSDIYYGDEEPRVINKIVYCHKDGTEVATLWEENQNLPILNSEK